jgi:hypothetical protein
MAIYSGFTMIYPLKLVIFHSFLYVYQRVNPIPHLLQIRGHPASNAGGAGRGAGATGAVKGAEATHRGSREQGSPPCLSVRFFGREVIIMDDDGSIWIMFFLTKIIITPITY